MCCIPLINLQNRDLAVRDLRKACLDSGFFYIEGHGVSEQILEEVFSVSQAFFSSPLEQKMAIHIEKSGIAHRGYIPYFEENVNPGEEKDFKEAYDLGIDFPTNHPFVLEKRPLFGQNQWPSGMKQFRSVLEKYFLEMKKVAHSLAELFALSLDLERKFFTQEMEDGSASLRLLHYPPQEPLHDSKETGCGAHTDYGLFTILKQDEQGGLEIRHKNGSWISATPIPGTFIINVADLLSRWTNDLYVSTEHRVRNPGKNHRYSIPFFVGVNSYTKVACLETCCSSSNPARYEPVSAGAYLLNRYHETFSANVSLAS